MPRDTAATLSPDAQSALDTCLLLLSSLRLGGPRGRAQFTSTLHPSGHMSHARYGRGMGVFYHDFRGALADFVSAAWADPATTPGYVVMEEALDGAATVLVDHDIAMVWTPYWFRRDGELSHVGTNCFNLAKVCTTEEGPREGEDEGVVVPKGKAGEEGCNWQWKIVVANDTARQPTAEEKERLDREYAARTKSET